MNKPECRVLQVFSTLGVGGAEVWLMALLRHYQQVKTDLPVQLKIDILLTGGPGHFDDEARSLGARLFYLPYSRRNLVRFVPAFRKILAAGKYHAIHDHQDYHAGWHILLGIGHLPPVRAVHVHNPLIHIEHLASTRLRKAVLNLGKRLVGRYATHILGTSRQLLTEYGFDEKLFASLPKRAAHCGFDVARYLGNHEEMQADVRQEFGWNKSSRIVLFVGRLNSNRNQKNPAFALEVGRICASEDPAVQLLVVGDGEEIRSQLEADVKSWGLENRIRFAGLRSDVPRLMLGADLLLFPSIAEGLGMVAVEAQAAGLRVLASDTTPRECVVIPDAVEFLSLDEGAAQWAAAVKRNLELPLPDRQKWNAAVRCSAFSIENSAATLLNIYQQPLTDELNAACALRVEWAGN